MNPSRIVRRPPPGKSLVERAMPATATLRACVALWNDHWSVWHPDVRLRRFRPCMYAPGPAVAGMARSYEMQIIPLERGFAAR